MSDKLRLGAIDTETKEYTLPSMAYKSRSYECVDCKKKVILKKGNIRAHHFAHSSQTNVCSYYDHPNEAQIHKDAKLLVKKLITEKNYISFTWECSICKGFYLEEVPSFKYKENDQAVIEYRSPDGKWIADIALINNNEVRSIIEIKNKHATTTERPEPWFEVDANSLHKIISEQMETKAKIENESVDYTPPFVFEIPCIRKNTDRKCYGSFCYKEQWVRRIPGHSNKNVDNSCILCNKKEYIPTYDGCTGKFQDGCIRVCQDCLNEDVYKKKLRHLYSTDINREQNVFSSKNSTLEVKSNNNDRYSREEKEILKKIPSLWKKFGHEVQYQQELPCIECKRIKYVPIYCDKTFKAICKICFGNTEVHKNIMSKIKDKNIEDEVECMISDD